MTAPLPSRRTVFTAAAAAGVGASFLGLGRPAAAGAFAGRKLVVIIQRGACDGLSLAPPIGDPDYHGLRGDIAISSDKALAIDSQFGLHPKLVKLHDLVMSGQARIAPAVALPQRIRSHFEAQDLLETGGAQLYQSTTGWLNRTLQAVQPGQTLTALSIGAQEPLILRGPAQAQSWSPGGRLNDQTNRVANALMDLYAGDPLLGPALASGLQTEAEADAINGGKPLNGADIQAFANTAAKFLVAPGGPSIAVLSLDGFDTHANQGAETGQLAGRLSLVDNVIAGLQTGLGEPWKDTVVVMATEFGRTARVNGTHGTDHGTASCLVLAGGALKAGGIIGDWPTLQQARLFENRDLAPTLDLRAVFKGVLIDHLGLDRRRIETAVFPNSREAQPVTGLV